MSYYSSQHPGFFIYLTLISVSVLSFLFFDISALEIGVFSILWSAFILARALSFFEIGLFQKSQNQLNDASKNKRSSILAYDLERRMNGKKNIKHGLFAMNAMHERTLLWFALSLIYFAYYCYLLIQSYHAINLMEYGALFLIIGSAFWAGQTYAYSHSASKLMMIVMSALFVLASFQLTNEFSLDWQKTALHNFTQYYDNNALPLLAGLIIYSAAILLYSCIYGARYRLNAYTGLAFLIVLILFGIALTPSLQVTAFLISGLGLFSIFWIRSYCHVSTRYKLYQSQ